MYESPLSRLENKNQIYAKNKMFCLEIQ